mgnify:FL=1
MTLSKNFKLILQVIQGIKEVYFSDANFDASDYELNVSI